MFIRLITIYICPSTMTYKNRREVMYQNRRENKDVMYNFIHGSKFEIQPIII